MAVLRTILLIAVLLVGWVVARGGLHLPAEARPVAAAPASVNPVQAAP